MFISYRDLELMLLDRGVEVDHTTIFRLDPDCNYAAELEKRIRNRSASRTSNWLIVAGGRGHVCSRRGQLTYLYRRR